VQLSQSHQKITVDLAMENIVTNAGTLGVAGYRWSTQAYVRRTSGLIMRAQCYHATMNYFFRFRSLLGQCHGNVLYNCTHKRCLGQRGNKTQDGPLSIPSHEYQRPLYVHTLSPSHSFQSGSNRILQPVSEPNWLLGIMVRYCARRMKAVAAERNNETFLILSPYRVGCKYQSCLAILKSKCRSHNCSTRGALAIGFNIGRSSRFAEKNHLHSQHRLLGSLENG
jgi:hypothetical protein